MFWKFLFIRYMIEPKASSLSDNKRTFMKNQDLTSHYFNWTNIREKKNLTYYLVQ